ncbi:CG34040 [Drosophila busckii]|uniref:CG34040 n=2 Tax=Drosophila busckii TaxID=30019 RepID=A0A0M4EIK9_DROBS|nr:CG34040 [Drosophila busckii]
MSLLCCSRAQAVDSCVYCRGINCQRSSYAATELCVDRLDACVSVFQGGRVQAQGCWEKVEERWRIQCQEQGTQCEICLTEKCNNVSPRQLSCLQCQDTQDEQCRTAPEQLIGKRCGIARTGRTFCYASIKDQHVERGCALNLTQQRSCLEDINCQLCDPLELGASCNKQLLQENEATTAPPDTSSSTSSSSSSSSTSTTSSSSSSSSSTSTTSSSSSSSTSTSTTTTAAPPTAPPTLPPTTAKPNSAATFNLNNLAFLLLFAQLVNFVCQPNK